MNRVGILGGGQLGCMLAESLLSLGAEPRFFTTSADAPACARHRDVVVAPWSDRGALASFAARCDVLTYETEHVEATALTEIGAHLLPSLDVLRTTQDRRREKRFLREAGFPHVHFAEADDRSSLAHIARSFGTPLVVKTARGGYDGKGQRSITDERSLARACEELDDENGFVLEERIELAMELSCIVARDDEGDEIVFPPLENTHRDHVLDFTVFPAEITPGVASAITALSLDVARALDVVGVLTVELFVAKTPSPRSRALRVDDRYICVNELAPRPHNSGHVTRNACTFSQFDALARVLTGATLTAPRTHAGAWCMANLLGADAVDARRWRIHPDVVDLVHYGKRVAAPRRKMGHVVTVAETRAAAIEAARSFRTNRSHVAEDERTRR